MLKHFTRSWEWRILHSSKEAQKELSLVDVQHSVVLFSSSSHTGALCCDLQGGLVTTMKTCMPYTEGFYFVHTAWPYPNYYPCI
jgi:hypothetical protein